MQLLALVWFVSSVFFYNMSLIASISFIWTFQIANSWVFWRGETLAASLLSPSMLLGYTIVFVGSWTTVLWLLQDAWEWWVICDG